MPDGTRWTTALILVLFLLTFLVVFAFFSDFVVAFFSRPLAELKKATPLEVATTSAGAALVRMILSKIAWGAAA